MQGSFPAGQFGVLYVDPPWAYEMYSDRGYGKSPDVHYDCMSLEALKALRDQVLFASAPNSVCIMWACFPMLREALALMDCWGFKCKTGGPWVKRTATGKEAFGTGYIFRSAAELFLIGTNGSPRLKNRSTRNVLVTGEWPEQPDGIDSIIVDSMRREHSRKPDEMIELIEGLFEGPYLEMFSRVRRPGWQVYGNQIDKFSEATTDQEPVCQ